jgi:phospholipase D1/2
LHTKLLIADNRVLHVGSANLNNRSMGIDTECDLVIEAKHERTEQAIAELRNRLLAEHLGTDPDAVARAMQQHGSLIAAVESLQGKGRTLKPLVDEITPEVDAMLPEAAVIDPERPLDPEELMNEFVPHEAQPSTRKRMTALAIAILVVAGIVALWRWSPLNELVTTQTLARAGEAIERSALAPLWVLGAYVIASMIAMPITVLIVATVMVFGASSGFVYALVGAMLGAAVSFGAGKLIGRHGVRRIAGEHINKLSHRLAKRGILAVFVVRVLPVAPFTIVNLVAGASHIRLRDYLIGTLLGLLPGMLAITLFSDRLVATLRDPSPKTIVVLAGAVVAIVAAMFLLRTLLKRHNMARAQGSRQGA